jgi:hypothetical protein
VPIKIHPEVISDHLNQVIHDFAFRAPVANALRMLRDPTFHKTFVQVAGVDAYTETLAWMKRITNEYRPADWGERLARRLNNNASIALLGLRVMTGLVQPTAITSAIPWLSDRGKLGSGERWLAVGANEFRKHPINAIKFAMQSSEFLTSRIQNRDRDSRQVLEGMGPDSIKQMIGAAAFRFIGMMDMTISVPIWTAGYHKSWTQQMEALRERARGGEFIKGVDIGAIHDTAVLAGDMAVRRSQGSGETFMIRRTESGSAWWQQFTKFMGYWAAFHQGMVRIGMMAKRGVITWPETAAMLLWIWVAPSLIEGMIRKIGEPEDDDETTFQWMMSQLGLHLVGGIPVVRDIARSAESGFDVSTPAIDALTNVGKTIGSITDYMTDEEKEELSRHETKLAWMAAGYTFGLPSNQLWQTYDAWAQMQEGEDVSLWELFVKGKKREK